MHGNCMSGSLSVLFAEKPTFLFSPPICLFAQLYRSRQAAVALMSDIEVMMVVAAKADIAKRHMID